MKSAILFAVLAAATLGATSASAATITYTEKASASGSLGSKHFSDALVTIIATGNTGGVSGSAGFYSNSVTGTLTIAGLGTTTFTDLLYAFDNQEEKAAGIADLTMGGSILDTYNRAFRTYHLSNGIGPVHGDSYIREDLSFHTLAGLFHLREACDSTFSATVTATPEPASLALFGFGGAAVLIGSLRRKRSAV